MNHKTAFSKISAGAGLAAAVALAAASFSVEAASPKTATFLVSLTVSSDCSISASPLNFGTATSTLATTPIPGTTNLAVLCSTGTAYVLSLDKGNTPGSTVTNRLLAGAGAPTVQYQLYSDGAHTAIWGDATGGATVAGTGTGSSVPITVYGQVPAQAIPAADTYTSTETATITF